MLFLALIVAAWFAVNAEHEYPQLMGDPLYDQTSRGAEVTPMLAPAFYPEKEAWKGQPGNRYTAEDLRKMERNWDVRILNPYRATCRSVD
jgi:hypothetical protein